MRRGEARRGEGREGETHPAELIDGAVAIGDGLLCARGGREVQLEPRDVRRAQLRLHSATHVSTDVTISYLLLCIVQYK